MTMTDALFDAIREGDTGALHQILEADPSLAAIPRDGVSPLRMAVYAGQAALADDLTKAGAAPDVFDAAALGDVDLVRDLIDEDPERTTAFAGDGFTALHLAAYFGHPKVAELLLARGADPQAVATDGSHLQPLHSAAAGGHLVIAHLLLDRGADIDARQNGGYAPIHSAAANGDVEMASMLLGRGADPAVVTEDGRTAADLTTDERIRALLP